MNGKPLPSGTPIKMPPLPENLGQKRLSEIYLLIEKVAETLQRQLTSYEQNKFECEDFVMTAVPCDSKVKINWKLLEPFHQKEGKVLVGFRERREFFTIGLREESATAFEDGSQIVCTEIPGEFIDENVAEGVTYCYTFISRYPPLGRKGGIRVLGTSRWVRFKVTVPAHLSVRVGLASVIAEARQLFATEAQTMGNLRMCEEHICYLGGQVAELFEQVYGDEEEEQEQEPAGLQSLRRLEEWSRIRAEIEKSEEFKRLPDTEQQFFVERERVKFFQDLSLGPLIGEKVHVDVKSQV